MPGNGIGASLPRLEDARLLTGGGCYSDDLTLPNQARGFMLRSQWDVAPFVKRGELARVLAGWEFDGADVLALVPARRGISARVSRFVEVLKGCFQPRPPWAL